MPRRLIFPALFLLGCCLAARATSGPVPVVLATDIGGDVDDTWALAQLLRTPGLDLKMVLTETGEARYRGAVTAKLLEAAGRTDVAVALGTDFGVTSEEYRVQGPWVRDYDLDAYPGPVHADGIGAFIALVMNSPQPVTVIAIGPAPSLGAALQREPRLAARCRFVGMFGSFDVGYDGSPVPVPETNVRFHTDLLRVVLAAPWQDILLTPLDTCGLVTLRDKNYHAVWSATSDPLLRAVIENYCIWAPRVPWMKCDFFAVRSSVLFDCVAVHLAQSENFVEIEPVRYQITSDGMTVRDPAGPLQARVALRWRDQAAFERHLTQVLLTPPPGQP
ncbi:ribonucleoside hydrolase RihC [Lacunisphaera limnophila]|uniref:Ribonucleoside hydrolase RihC n=1 Tax=Lacunisphaera limnophila TaxID=1838286 RepID=A0A1D8B019_9BACT|nr:nucleoside hydrolase [Lacunisphaera limnophila]AOS46464.1 ribonucleoside hydrolase RihC [Lacunisphaera limnophila]